MFAKKLLSSYSLRTSTLSYCTPRQIPKSIHLPKRSLSSYTFNKMPQLSSTYTLLSQTIIRPWVAPSKTQRNFSVYNSSQQGSSTPSGNPSRSWNGWIIAIIVSAITFPFAKDKLSSFLRIKNEVEVIVEDAEVVAEVVEKVAEGVVEITDELSHNFPDGGKLKDAIDIVENVAKEIVKDANIAEDIIHKVEEVEKEVESVIEPLMDQVNVKITKEAGDISVPIHNIEEKYPKANL